MIPVHRRATQDIRVFRSMSPRRQGRQPCASVIASGLRVRSVNGDIGDLNAVLDTGQRVERSDHLDRLLDLTAATNALALVLPNGALAHDPIVDETTDIT